MVEKIFSKAKKTSSLGDTIILQNMFNIVQTEPDKIDGKCGPCGDDIREKVPRANENGGTYGKGNVART